MKKEAPAPGQIHLRLRNLVAALHRAIHFTKLTDLPVRVRELPDERTLRFYTTVGLLAPPVRFDGRRALYGRIHLLQLLSIKRLQARGHSIKEIQALLRDASMARLADIADIDSSAIQQAMSDSQRDPVLNLWPRSGPGRVIPSSRQSSAGKKTASSAPAVETHKVSEGMYLTVDSTAHPWTKRLISQRLLEFASQLESPPSADEKSFGGVSP